jgi:hypothetical protein
MLFSKKQHSHTTWISLSNLFFCLLILAHSAKGQSRLTSCGYSDKGDSIEFIFGQQNKIRIGGVEVLLKDRFGEIRKLNVAGDFNDWNPKDTKYVAVRGNDKLFRLTVAKTQIGKKGETKQFKFVINQVYWVEPPADAVNQRTGKDGNTNFTLKL